MLATPFTRAVGIQHPIVQAGMGDAGPDLAVAVSEAGALGSLGTIGKSPSQVADQIAETRSRTSRPFAVNVVTFDWAPFAREHVSVALQAGAPVITLSFGDPASGLAACVEAGVPAIVQVQDVAGLRRAIAARPVLVIAQGGEAGGHTGTRGTLSFAAQALRLAGDVPVGVAGGIADARGVAAALAMGAAAAVVGTRFKTCPEYPGVQRETEEILASDGSNTFAGPENDAVYGLQWPEGVVGRAIRNEFTERWEGRTSEIRERIAAQSRPFELIGEIVASGTSVNWAGESSALVYRVMPAADVVRELVTGAEDLLARAASLARA